MMDMDYAAVAHRLSIIALPILIAITLHEAAHGFVAWKRGDDTAYMLLVPIGALDTTCKYTLHWNKR